MFDVVELFRGKLAEKLREALADRDKETIRVLRTILAAIDNASAVSQERADSHTTEVPRRRLKKREIVEVLQSEIDEMRATADQYDRVGNSGQAIQLRKDIATIEHLMTLLHESDR